VGIAKFSPLTQGEITILFRILQDRLVADRNTTGLGCVLRQPTPEQLAGVKTPRQLESLVRVCTRPI
jgi:hypothetical protein